MESEKVDKARSDLGIYLADALDWFGSEDAMDIASVAFTEMKPAAFVGLNPMIAKDFCNLKRLAEGCGLEVRPDYYNQHVFIAKDKETLDKLEEVRYPKELYPEGIDSANSYFAEMLCLSADILDGAEELEGLLDSGRLFEAFSFMAERFDTLGEGRSRAEKEIEKRFDEHRTSLKRGKKVSFPDDFEFRIGELLGYPPWDTQGLEDGKRSLPNAKELYPSLTHAIYSENFVDEALDDIRTQKVWAHSPRLASALDLPEVDEELVEARREFGRYVVDHLDDFRGSGPFHRYGSAIEILAVALAEKPLSFLPINKVTDFETFKEKAERCGLFVARDEAYHMNVVVAKNRVLFDRYVAVEYPQGFGVLPEPAQEFVQYFSDKVGLGDEVRELIEDDDWEGVDKLLRPKVTAFLSKHGGEAGEVRERYEEMKEKIAAGVPDDMEYRLGLLLGYPERDVIEVLLRGYSGRESTVTPQYPALAHWIYEKNGEDDFLNNLRVSAFRHYLGKDAEKVLDSE